MRKLTIIIFVISVIVILQGCAASPKELPEPEGTLLSQSELEELFKNECTYDYKTNSGEWGTQTHFPTGVQNLHWKVRGNSGNIAGTYTIENGQKCNKWDDPSLKVKCWEYYKISDKEYNIDCTNCTGRAKVTFK